MAMHMLHCSMHVRFCVYSNLINSQKGSTALTNARAHGHSAIIELLQLKVTELETETKVKAEV